MKCVYLESNPIFLTCSTLSKLETGQLELLLNISSMSVNIKPSRFFATVAIVIRLAGKYFWNRNHRKERPSSTITVWILDDEQSVRHAWWLLFPLTPFQSKDYPQLSRSDKAETPSAYLSRFFVMPWYLTITFLVQKCIPNKMCGKILNIWNATRHQAFM